MVQIIINMRAILELLRNECINIVKYNEHHKPYQYKETNVCNQFNNLV